MTAVLRGMTEWHGCIAENLIVANTCSPMMEEEYYNPNHMAQLGECSAM